jgi:acetoin utilization deacetylase AcuC-like enzyme
VDDPLASMRVTTAGYAAVIKILKGAAIRTQCPIALVTEGGYDMDALRACIDATLEALTGETPVAIASESRDAPRGARALEAVRTVQPRWRDIL